MFPFRTAVESDGPHCCLQFFELSAGSYRVELGFRADGSLVREVAARVTHDSRGFCSDDPVLADLAGVVHVDRPLWPLPPDAAIGFSLRGAHGGVDHMVEGGFPAEPE